jgi:putative endonuclease
MRNIHWKVYLVQCADNTLYCGITNAITSRIQKHNAGKGAKYTKSRLPVKIMAVSRGMSKSDAIRLERYIKRKPAGEKVAVLNKGHKSS